MNRPATETGFRRILRGSMPENRAEFERAWHREHRKLNPSPEQLHLDTLAWASAQLRALGEEFTGYPTEKAQYVALHALRVGELNRPLRTEESEQLRRASRAMWVACSPHDAPKGAA